MVALVVVCFHIFNEQHLRNVFHFLNYININIEINIFWQFPLLLKTVMSILPDTLSFLKNIYIYIYIYICCPCHLLHKYFCIFEVTAYNSIAFTWKMSLSIAFWIAFFHILFRLYFNLLCYGILFIQVVSLKTYCKLCNGIGFKHLHISSNRKNCFQICHGMSYVQMQHRPYQLLYSCWK